MKKLIYPAVSSLLLNCAFLATAHASAKTSPNLSAKDLAGHSHKLSELRGQIVVLSFWATWCGPCREELPRLSRLSATYAGKNVHFIAVPLDDPKDRKKIEPFLQQQQINLDTWVGPDTDTLDRFSLGDIVPDTVIIDQNGVIISRIMGEAQDADVKTRLDWLLNGRPALHPKKN